MTDALIVGAIIIAGLGYVYQLGYKDGYDVRYTPPKRRHRRWKRSTRSLTK